MNIHADNTAIFKETITYRFGDDYNDKEIMQQVGIGIAVENATSEIKQIAYNVCASNDQDGPAEWIKKNLL